MNSYRRKSGNARPTPLLILLVVLIGVGLFSVYLWDRHEQKQEAARYEGESLYRPGEYSYTADGVSYGLRDGLECFLLIGLDKLSTQNPDPEAHRNQQQADFLVLMLVDHADQSFRALHINRDTMTTIQRYGLAGMKLQSMYAQLALAHTYGNGGTLSCRYTCDAVSGLLLGVPIRHYMSLTMDAIPVLNDLVGGVTVTIEDDFSQVDPELVQGRTQRLVGQQALTFVRARGSMTDSSNLKRMERQRSYLAGLYEQLTASLRGGENFSMRLATALSDYAVSDLSVEEISELAERIKDYRYEGIETLEGEAVVGEQFMEFYPDLDALEAQVIRLMLTEN